MDAVIKIGGSLSKKPEKLRGLAQTISEIAQKNEIVVVPGGGEFADVVRDFDQTFHLSDQVAHKMARLGMDQFGLLLSDIIPKSRTASNFDEVLECPSSKGVPIFLSSHLIFEKDPLENSWIVTSDTIAAYVATQLKADNLILATDVDGLFTKDPSKYESAEFISKIGASELLSWTESACVDRYLPRFLAAKKIKCFVVNGYYPERIRAILTGKRTKCTLINDDAEKISL